MTPAHIEAAARYYCKLTQQDPERMVTAPPVISKSGVVVGELDLCPLWKVVAEKIRDQALIAAAIEATRPIRPLPAYLRPTQTEKEKD